ncbi:hypothetical protein HDU83_005284 [Entophlyctis luteolus]|nr:hypothetical protein HDU82_007255 [Entophlyctis luteolus]KAJ3344382.1 hypothetical protein HDU83_005284 [Entophlyctis luteolus]
MSSASALIEDTLRRSTAALAKVQHDDGHFVGVVQTNATVDAEWCLALWCIGLDNHPLRNRLGRALLNSQRPDGSWEVFYGAPTGDINATVEAYAALCSLGIQKNSDHLSRARNWIFAKGGLSGIRVFTRYWLALIGEWPWRHTPNIPPEVLVSQLHGFSIYSLAQWARATLMPIGLLSSQRPVRRLPDAWRLDELFPGGRENFDYGMPSNPLAGPFWNLFFRTGDTCSHWVQEWGLVPFRRLARAYVRDWIVTRQASDGTWSGVQPPWVYSILALKAEGFPLSHPIMVKALEPLENLSLGWRVDDGDASSIQATNSPVWDTIQAVIAFSDSGLIDQYSESVDKAVQWIMDHQILVPGDWSIKHPGLLPGGWAFEYSNDFYPDFDDTALALIALSHFRNVGKWQNRGIEAAIERGINWLLAMQSSNGGWAAFDNDNNSQFLTKLPFCEFGEVIDPTSVDVTSHVMEALGKNGFSYSHPSVKRACEYLFKVQEPDGSWFGRWGVNYVYGTGAVIPALASIGFDMNDARVGRGCEWLRAHQMASGGWGESCVSYIEDESAGKAKTATASQTAWALMALVAANRPEDRPAILEGSKFLVDTLSAESGTWREPEFTGTGFPGYGVGQTAKLSDPALLSRLRQGPELSRAFMLHYGLYSHYYPIVALGRCQKLLEKVHK